MCNINIIISKKPFKNNSKMIECFMQSVTAASYVYNSYADGVYFNSNNSVHKDSNKLNLLQFSKEFKDSNIILTHQRLATHGFNTNSNQPFIKDDFVLLHNGVLSEYGKLDDTKSDSLNLFEHFISLFDEKIKGILNKDTYRESIILQCIKESIEDKTGSYSIVLFDIKTQIIYYFKNSSTDINFFRGKDALFITTKEDNKDFLTLLEQKFNKIKIKNHAIYKVFINDEIRIHKIGKIKQVTYFTNTPRVTEHIHLNKNYNAYGSSSLDYLGKEDLIYMNEPHLCFYCKKNTYTFSTEIKEYCCKICFEDLNKYPKYI